MIIIVGFLISTLQPVSLETLQEIAVVINKDTKRSQGSGVFITDSRIITCAHTVARNKTLNLTVQVSLNERDLIGEIIKYDEESDLALVQVKGKYRYAELRLSPRIGEKIYVVGAPIGYEDTITFGRIANIFENKLIIDARISGGSSGSGVFDKRGYLLGIVYKSSFIQFSLKDWTNLAIRANKIKEFLEDKNGN